MVARKDIKLVVRKDIKLVAREDIKLVAREDIKLVAREELLSKNLLLWKFLCILVTREGKWVTKKTCEGLGSPG